MSETSIQTGNSAPVRGDTPTLQLNHLPFYLEQPGVTPSDSKPTMSASRSSRPSIPGYDIQSELGRGGMGVVYQARHLGLNRDVALKVILSGAYSSEIDRVRFRQEGEAVAKLRHPNIVGVYDIGDTGAHSYIAFELVAGGTLRHWQKNKPIEPRLAAGIMARVAHAVAHAHERGILHRDLKPSNILLQKHDLSSSSTIDQLNSAKLPAITVLPLVADFGLAKKIEGGLSLTESGMLCGTPNYMAPEQVSDAKGAVSPATDIYALGAILYELVSGSVPFADHLPIEILTKLTTIGLTPIRSVCPLLPRDLSTIIDKCLERDPKKRYASANDLAEDLERYLLGRSIRARAIGPVERTSRWVRRNPMPTTIISLLAFGFLLSVGGLGILGHFLATAQTAREEAEQARDETRLALTQAEIDRERARIALTQAEKDRAIAQAAENRAMLSAVETEEKKKNAEAHGAVSREALSKVLHLISNHERVRRDDLIPLRKDIYDQILPLYDKFLKLAGNDQDIQLEKAKILSKLMDLKAEIGDVAGAVREGQKSMDLYCNILKSSPHRREVQIEYAGALTNYGSNLAKINKFDDAIQAQRDAIQVYDAILIETPNDAHLLAEKLRCHVNLTFCLSHSGNRKEWIRETQTSLEAAEIAFDRFPNLPQMALVTAHLRYNMASLSNNLGERADANCRYTQAAELFRLAARTLPDPSHRTRAWSEYANTAYYIAHYSIHVGNIPAADEHFAEAERVLKEITTASPHVLSYWNARARVICDRGTLWLNQEKPEIAMKYYNEAIFAADRSIQCDSPNPQHLKIASICSFNRGKVLNFFGNWAESAKAFIRAAELEPHSIENRVNYRSEAASMYLNLGQWKDGLNQIEEIKKHAGKGMTVSYEVARFYMLYAQMAADAKNEKPMSAQQAEKKAMAALRDAKQEGYFKHKLLREQYEKDRLFDAIRDFVIIDE